MYSLNSHKMFYDVADNQAIIIDASTGVYYALGPLASITFDFLARGASPAAVLAALVRIPGAPDDMEIRLNEFAERLLHEEILITAADGFSGSVTIDPALAAEGFALEMDAFDDAKDIMLADPVHDIDLDQGWPFLKEPDDA